MIKEDFVSYEVAKLLKENGFDILTGKVYDNQNKLDYQNVVCWQKKRLPYISAPTHQMAMKWLREKHHFFIEVGTSIDLNGNYHFSYAILDERCIARMGYTNFDYYEDAIEAALKYTLENLLCN